MIRTRLRLFVRLWLVSQLAALSAAPVLSAAGVEFQAAAPCDCPDGEPGAACPMHKSPARSSKPGGNCVMTSACPPSDAALLSLVTGLGVLAASAAFEPSIVASPVRLLRSTASSRFSVPDAPPPRA